MALPKKMFSRRFAGLQIVIDDRIPVESENPETGEMQKVSHYEFEGKVYMRQEVFDEFVKQCVIFVPEDQGD